jgi:hypothetical protein
MIHDVIINHVREKFDVEVVQNDKTPMVYQIYDAGLDLWFGKIGVLVIENYYDHLGYNSTKKKTGIQYADPEFYVKLDTIVAARILF